MQLIPAISQPRQARIEANCSLQSQSQVAHSGTWWMRDLWQSPAWTSSAYVQLDQPVLGLAPHLTPHALPRGAGVSACQSPSAGATANALLSHAHLQQQQQCSAFDYSCQIHPVVT